MEMFQGTTQFPAWTNVMRHIFLSSSDKAISARSETYFGDVKQNVLENHKPIRVDKFLIKYMRSVTKIMRLGRAAYNQQKDEANCVKKTISEGNVLNFKENWRNLISTSEVFDEDNCSKQELVIDKLTDDFVINDEVCVYNFTINICKKYKQRYTNNKFTSCC